MNEAGLPEKWRRYFQMGKNAGNRAADKERKSKKKDQRITLTNMSGAFVVLLVGIFSSIVIFITELVLRHSESSSESQPGVQISDTVDGNKHESVAALKQKTPIKNPSRNGIINKADERHNENNNEQGEFSVVIIHSQPHDQIPIENDKKMVKEKTTGEINIS